MIIDADHARPGHIWQLIDVLQRDRSVAMARASALQNLPDIFGVALGVTTTVLLLLIMTDVRV